MQALFISTVSPEQLQRSMLLKILRSLLSATGLDNALCGQHRTVPDFDVAAICQTPGRSWWVRLPSNLSEKRMGCLASRRKGVLVFWWLGRDGTDRTGACTGEKN